MVPSGHTSLPNIDGTLQIFIEVNTFRARLRQPPLFKVQLVGLHKEESQRDGLFTIAPDCLTDIEKIDLLIIPALHGDLAAAMEKNAAFIP